MHHHREQRIVHGNSVLIAPILHDGADASPEEPPMFKDERGPLTGSAAMDAKYSEAPKAHRDAHRPTGNADIEGDWEHSNDKRHSDENEEESQSDRQSRQPLSNSGISRIRQLSEVSQKNVALCCIVLHFPRYRKVGPSAAASACGRSFIVWYMRSCMSNRAKAGNEVP